MKQLIIQVLRQKPGEAAHWERYPYEAAEETETAATALTHLNETLEDPIRWECNCLQKKCGACAMVVNGKPMLACQARLADFPKGLRLEPLKKFPLIQDLMVDRSTMRDDLRDLRLWFAEDAVRKDGALSASYEASRCLQCGCCLEVCPNFLPGERFSGMAAGVPMARLLAQLPESQKKEAARLYRDQIYEGCGKSLACRGVCPAKIDIDSLLAGSNAVAVWKRFFR